MVPTAARRPQDGGLCASTMSRRVERPPGREPECRGERLAQLRAGREADQHDVVAAWSELDRGPGLDHDLCDLRHRHRVPADRPVLVPTAAA